MFLSYSFNEGTSIFNLTEAPDTRRTNGTYFISQSLVGRSTRAIAADVSLRGGYEIHLDILRDRYGVPITTKVFYPCCLQTLHEISFIRTTDNTIDTLRSQLCIPDNAVRSLENSIRKFTEPVCIKCGIPRMCEFTCTGPEILETHLQDEIAECLETHYPAEFAACVTRAGYRKFYRYLASATPLQVVFASHYIDALWSCHSIPRNAMPDLGINILYPCVVVFNSSFAKAAKSGQDMLISGRKRKRVAAGKSAFVMDEDHPARFDVYRPPPFKRRRVDGYLVDIDEMVMMTTHCAYASTRKPCQDNDDLGHWKQNFHCSTSYKLKFCVETCSFNILFCLLTRTLVERPWIRLYVVNLRIFCLLNLIDEKRLNIV